MDAITMLRTDHQEVKRLFRRFENAGDNAHTTKRDIVERIKPLNDGNTLHIEYELTDPKSFEGTWKYTKRWRRVEDRDIAEVSCLPELNDHMPTTKSGANVR